METLRSSRRARLVRTRFFLSSTIWSQISVDRGFAHQRKHAGKDRLTTRAPASAIHPAGNLDGCVVDAANRMTAAATEQHIWQPAMAAFFGLGERHRLLHSTRPCLATPDAGSLKRATMWCPARLANFGHRCSSGSRWRRAPIRPPNLPPLRS